VVPQQGCYMSLVVFFACFNNFINEKSQSSERAGISVMVSKTAHTYVINGYNAKGVFT